MAQALQTRMTGYTTHQSGHVMAPADIVYEVEPVAKMPLVPFLVGLIVRVIFAVSPFLLAIALLVRAGWLPS